MVKSLLPTVKTMWKKIMRKSVSWLIGPNFRTCRSKSYSSSCRIGFKYPKCFFQRSSPLFTILNMLSPASVISGSSKHPFAMTSADQASTRAFPISGSPTPDSSPA